MPDVNVVNPSKLDQIHIRRMLHAFAQVLGRLLLLEEPAVQMLLAAYQITLLPGPRIGIEYPDGVKQILSLELQQEKAAIQAQRNVLVKAIKSHKKKRTEKEK